MSATNIPAPRDYNILHVLLGEFIDVERNDSPLFDSFRTTTRDEDIEIVKQSANESCPLDPLLTSLLKDNISMLALVISNIVNLSLSTGAIKQAFVTHLYKKLTTNLNFGLYLANY